GPDVILDAWPEQQRGGDLHAVVEFGELLAGLDRRSRRLLLKLKPWIDRGPHPAEGQDVQLTARKHAAGSKSRLIIIFEFRGVLVTDVKDAENRQPLGVLWPPLDDLLCRLGVETVKPLVVDVGIGQIG